MATEERGLTERQRYWLEHIEACEASGESLKVYAAARGFSPGAIYAAKKVLIRKGVVTAARSRFQRVDTSVPAMGWEWRIELPNGVAVGFSGAVDGGSLRAVLSAVYELG